MNRFFSLSRTGAVLIKEFIQMRRDRITFAMMLGVPLMQLLLFGYAINMDPKGLPAALVPLDQGRYARAVVSALENTDYYRFDYVVGSIAEAEELILAGDVAFVVTIPSDFTRRVERGESPQILVDADASDPTAATNALGALPQLARRALSRELGQELQAAEESTRNLEIVVHRRYNPEGISQYNIVPALLGVILQMTMVMMTAMALTREVERGTMENLLAMPANPLEIMIGKVTPYIGVGAVQVVVVLTTAKLLFSIPFVGSLALLLAAILVFIIALVLLGYTFSTFARTQMQAMQLTFFFFLPSIMLSGFMFPFRGMPEWAQVFGEVLPLTHFLRVVRGIMLKGADWRAISFEVWVLVAFVLAYAVMALLRFRRTLD
ncbi:ABC transporter permease [Rhodobium gokarnense]|uniref:ABC-2 type transport system permease protein n=1 Tax=Rhodobium gokarnense TaxID=364296 RepID=A0ABT3H8S2_9HYPH|nr:ABC transporter permease [Rhodobium gokarnense]MCW2306807.1 ABC-2 type transport system permease protein [Rhodobium gokarnense]